jgi:type IV pilus assembly protein PilE
MDHQLMRRTGGFTLIELMVVVAIVAIIATIAFPSYQDSVRKSNRGSAKARMTEVEGRLASHYSDNGTYTATLTELGYAEGDLKSEAGKHVITVTAGEAGIESSFIIEATAEGEDPGCTPLTLNHLGAMGPAGC